MDTDGKVLDSSLEPKVKSNLNPTDLLYAFRL